jgi:V-type H+-transporting ATPase subunit D
MPQAQVRVIAQTDNVAGVRIPKFQQNNISGESKMNLTGLGKGGQQVQQCRKVGLGGFEIASAASWPGIVRASACHPW